jgi:hypothetical protein
MVLLQSSVFVWRISPEVFCRWSLFKVMFLCGALDQRCSADGPPFRLYNFEEGPSTKHPRVMLQAKTQL